MALDDGLLRITGITTSNADLPLLDERDGVLVITLNRPHARIAVDAAMARGVAAALDRLDACGQLQVAIISGACRSR